MVDTINELSEELRQFFNSKLFFFHGDTVQVLENIHKNVVPVKYIGFNKDYTPFARKREHDISKFAVSIGASVICEEDILLYPIMLTLKKDGTPYKVFTPFKNHTDGLQVRRPESKAPAIPAINKEIATRLETYTIKDISIYKTAHDTRIAMGGRKKADKALSQDFRSYPDNRNILSKSTTMLSPYISFGVLSIREVYWKFATEYGKDSLLVTQLQWRDFFTMIQYFFPYVIKSNFKPQFDNMEWDNDPNMFKKWVAGETGFPCVDAAMRQLLQEGFVHNRSRMIASSFLVKHMLTHWRYGERHYAKHLTDVYFPSNNGGWQWTFGGVDPNWFRVFNPFTQGEKYDPKCEYIKKYVPELKDVPNEHIHQWDKFYMTYKGRVNYPPPCLDLKERRDLFLKRAKQCIRK